MCVICHKPAGYELDEIILKNCFNRNEHGAGIAYVKDGKLVIDKGYKDLDKFLAAVQAVMELELVIHCRVASKGDVTDDNIHPFPIQSALFPQYSFAFCHNGTLTWRSTAEKSDSRHFAEDVLQQILDRDPYRFENGIDRAMMGSFIGSSNKFCIMGYNSKKNESSVQFINKVEGMNYEGCWFSNLSWTDDCSRYPNDADRKRYDNWAPKLWTEPVKYVAPTMGNHGAHAGYGRGKEDFFPADSNPEKDWVYHKKFGWYNQNHNYEGHRCHKDFKKAMGIVDQPKDPPKIEPKKEDEKNYDKMDFLSPDEKRQAREHCMEIVKDSFPDFKFTGVSTAEVCTWGRAELRGLIPELRDMSNEQLMTHILYGEDVSVHEGKDGPGI